MVAAQLAGGLLLLFLGGELFVRGAAGVALRLGVSPLLIGLTLVGFGTSLPELVASVEAARLGSPGIALGNVIGSNIANIMLILGISALIAPLAVARGMLLRDGPVLMAVTLLALAACLWGRIDWRLGLLFLGLLLAYLLHAYFAERRSCAESRGGPETASDAASENRAGEAERRPSGWNSLAGGLAQAAAGLAGVVLGAGLLVRAAVVVARDLGLSETVIGLTVVALGTSLPELATSVVAAYRRQGDIALGNIVGSNIFNILGILGVTALITPIRVPAEIMAFDGWAMLGATLLLLVFGFTDARLDRWEGGVLTAGYIGYLGVLLVP